MKIIMCYVPFPTIESAQKVVSLLLEKRLIACGNVVHSESMYIWQSNLTQDNEWIAIMKTTQTKQQNLVDKIESLHPYDLPAILCWKVDANPAYVQWVAEQVND